MKSFKSHTLLRRFYSHSYLLCAPPLELLEFFSRSLASGPLFQRSTACCHPNSSQRRPSMSLPCMYGLPSPSESAFLCMKRIPCSFRAFFIPLYSLCFLTLLNLTNLSRVIVVKIDRSIAQLNFSFLPSFSQYYFLSCELLDVDDNCSWWGVGSGFLQQGTMSLLYFQIQVLW